MSIDPQTARRRREKAEATMERRAQAHAVAVGDVWGRWRSPAETPAPPPWPDGRTAAVRPRLIAALLALRACATPEQVVAVIRAQDVDPAAIAIRVREYGLALINRATEAQAAVIADYPSPILIAAMSESASVLAILDNPVIALRVLAYQAQATAQDAPAAIRPWATPPAWRSGLGRPLRRGE